MNERIQQLAQEAGMYVDLNGNPWPKWMSAEECEVAYKKFAELIVKECIEQASIGNGHGNNQWDRALTFSAKNIKEHFGVEE